MKIDRDVLYRLLLDANETALRRGDKYGLCDAIDNDGNPYPSQFLADVIDKAVKHVVKADRIPLVKSKGKKKNRSN